MVDERGKGESGTTFNKSFVHYITSGSECMVLD